MFAPKIAKAQTKTTQIPANKLAPQRSTLVAQPFGGGAVERAHFLQSTIGNQATSRLLSQRARNLNEPHGPNEQDADPASLTAQVAQPGLSWDFSKIPVFPPDQASRPQQSSPLAVMPLPGAIQAKLKVGAVNAPLEHEADRVADEAMRMPTPGVSIASTLPQISRKYAACQEEGGKLQKKPAGPQAAAGEAPGIVHEVLRSLGQPLDAPSRAYFEPRFGHDFSRVRVHNDSKASESARAVNALAYTVGRDVVFGEGQYAPNTRAGQRLLAHELTHVAQQSQSGTPTIQRQTSYFGPTSGAPSDWATQAAAAKTSADRAALIQKVVGLTVSDATTASASDVSADAAHLVEYSASSQKINYDDNLNKKQGRDKRSLKDNAGYTLNAGGKFYIILGPKAIDPGRYYLPLVILNHELAHVRQNLSGSTLSGYEAELDAWTTSFIRDFHRSYLLGDTGTTCFVQDVSTWTPFLDYYQRQGVSATQQDNSVKRIKDYYNMTLKVHEGHKNAFRYWIYRSLKSSANPNIADRLNTELKLGISASDQAAKIRQFPCGALKSLTYSAPTLDKPTLSTPTSEHRAPARIFDNPSPIFR